MSDPVTQDQVRERTRVALLSEAAERKARAQADLVAARGEASGSSVRKARPKRAETPAHELSEYTDVGNARRIAREHGARLRCVGKWGAWLVFDGKRWVLDDAHEIEAMAVETFRGMLLEASHELAAARAAGDAEREGRARTAMGWATECHGAKLVRNAVFLLPAVDRGLAIGHDALDADPWLLNVDNGTIDLRTGELRPHAAEDLCTKLAPVAYDPRATCPTWDAFLLRAMGGDPELVAYLRRMVGYALTGVIREHVLGFLFGGGANGKTTFTSTIHKLLGGYAVHAPRGLIFRSSGNEHDTRFVPLFGARFATLSEIEEQASFDEALVKDLTGGDPITARRMREDNWTFQPTHKLFIAGNHKPRVRGSDEGIWRRIRLIPWTVTIPEAERDTELPAKLLGELPGILAWAVRGCLEWQAIGLGEPVVVRDATAAYREASDPLREFFAGYCVFEPEARVARKTLRETYEAWAKENGAEPLGAKRFTEGLRGRGVGEVSVRNPVTGKVADGWRGVRLQTDREREATLDPRAEP